MSNLSEEEKKAIDILENRLDILHNNTQWATENSIKVVLNLIERQQKEINKEKEKNKKVKKFCKEKSTFQTFGDEDMKYVLETYINRLKNRILDLLED